MINYTQYLTDSIVSSGWSYSPPTSTGLDGYMVSTPQLDFFIPNHFISMAETEASLVRTGFIKGDILYCLPDDVVVEVKVQAFKECLARLLRPILEPMFHKSTTAQPLNPIVF